MNHTVIRSGFVCSVLCSLFATFGCGSSDPTPASADGTTGQAAPDPRAIYSGIDNVCEMATDRSNIYWSVDINGDDVKDIGGLWRAPKDGSGKPVRLAKAREARMLTSIGNDIYYLDKDGPAGVYRVSDTGVVKTNAKALWSDPFTILSDAKTLYGLVRKPTASSPWNEDLVVYDSAQDSWSTLVSNAGDIDSIVAVGDYLYMTIYGQDEANSTLAKVSKSGGTVEQIRLLSTEFGDLYSAGSRLLLRSWGAGETPTVVEELNANDGSVKQAVEVNGCTDVDNWRRYNESFYCFDGPNFKSFAEDSPFSQLIVGDDEIWEMTIDDQFVYWAGTQTVGGMWVKSVYIGRQSR